MKGDFEELRADKLALVDSQRALLEESGRLLKDSEIRHDQADKFMERLKQIVVRSQQKLEVQAGRGVFIRCS